MCTNGVCPEHRPAPANVSVDDATLDSMVQQASKPNLATLFRQAKQAGVIGATTVYGESA